MSSGTWAIARALGGIALLRQSLHGLDDLHGAGAQH
jgi:hypothetical protein